MLKISQEDLDHWESQHEGIISQIYHYENACLPSCANCESSNTAKVAAGLVGRTIGISSATTKFKLVPNHRPGKYFCNACEQFFGSFDISDDLWEAYKATVYQADTPFGELSIRVGEVAPRLDAHLLESGTEEWAFISAHNPGSQQLGEAENALRHEHLEAEIADVDYPYFTGRGVGSDPAWSPEKSLLVIGISREEAIEVGQRFGQNAVVWGRLNQPAELVACQAHRAK